MGQIFRDKQITKLGQTIRDGGSTLYPGFISFSIVILVRKREKMKEMPIDQEIRWKKNKFTRNRCWRRKHHSDYYDPDDQSQSFSQSSLHVSLSKSTATDDEADNKTWSMSKTSTTDYENDNKASSLDSDYSPDRHKWQWRLGSNLFESFKPMKSKESFENQVKALAELALAQHNKDKSAHYEYVRSSGPINPARSGNRSWGHKHMNFFAKLKGTDASPELFFAVIHRRKKEVAHCCILNPKPCSDGDAYQEQRVYHCKDVECRNCAYFERQRAANCRIFFV